MSDKSGFIPYKGREILYVDYTGVEDAEMLRERIRHAEDLIMSSGKKDLLELVDVSGSFAEPESIILLKESAKITAPYVRKGAIVGVSGVKKVLLNFIKKFSGLNMEPKDTLDEAKDWLAED